MTAAPRRLEATLRAFADRLFVTGGSDPGDAALALPPPRLHLYRDLMRGNYRAMLRFAFTQAFELMDREIAGANGTAGLPASTVAIIVRFLEVSPSRTHSSREIADRFLAFFPGEYPKLAARRPDLVDLMKLERAELHTLLAADDPGRCLSAEEVDTLAGGALDDLLALRILRAPSASVLRVQHPVVELRAALERGDITPVARTGGECATVSRGAPPRFGIEFAVHDDAARLVFDAADPGVPMTGERLATNWFAALEEPAASKGDEWKAGTFATAVIGGLRAGFFRTN